VLKKLFLFLIIIAIVAVFLTGIFSVSFSPFSLTISKPEKDFLKKVGGKIKSIIYREATEHNPEGDILPDQIDDEIKQEIKSRVN